MVQWFYLHSIRQLLDTETIIKKVSPNLLYPFVETK